MKGGLLYDSTNHGGGEVRRSGGRLQVHDGFEEKRRL